MEELRADHVYRMEDWPKIHIQLGQKIEEKESCVSVSSLATIWHNGVIMSQIRGKNFQCRFQNKDRLQL